MRRKLSPGGLVRDTDSPGILLQKIRGREVTAGDAVLIVYDFRLFNVNPRRRRESGRLGTASHAFRGLDFCRHGLV